MPKDVLLRRESAGGCIAAIMRSLEAALVRSSLFALWAPAIAYGRRPDAGLARGYDLTATSRGDSDVRVVRQGVLAKSDLTLQPVDPLQVRTGA